MTEGTNSWPFLLIREVVGRDVYKLRGEHLNTIVDVGANVGVFSIYAASLFPNATVYAVEPDPTNIEKLRANIALSGLKNIQVVEAAIDKDYGTRKLFLSNRSDVNHSFYSSYTKTSDGVDVPTIPLSHFDAIDFLKFDAEGAEYDAMEKLGQWQYAAIEIHNVEGKSQASFLNHLREKYDVSFLEDGSNTAMWYLKLI